GKIQNPAGDIWVAVSAPYLGNIPHRDIRARQKISPLPMSKTLFRSPMKTSTAELCAATISPFSKSMRTHRFLNRGSSQGKGAFQELINFEILLPANKFLFSERFSLIQTIIKFGATII